MTQGHSDYSASELLSTPTRVSDRRAEEILTASRPLCVDMDDALFRSNLLMEAFLSLVKRNPLNLLRVLIWAFRGRTVLKTELAVHAPLEPAFLPVDPGVLRWLVSQRDHGRLLWLCTSWNGPLAERVVAHLAIFEGVLHGKSEVTADSALLRNLRTRPNILSSVIRSIRVHQWAKNLLVLLPLMAAHRAGELDRLLAGLLAVVAFCLCSSSVYVSNDLFDLQADRAHPRKSKRPFAAGDLSLVVGLSLAPTLLAAASLTAVMLPVTFRLVLLAYYLTTMVYCMGAKGIVLVDAVVLAGLYTLRIIAGAYAVGVPLSFWMLLFSVFLFLSLAFAKRFTELDSLRRQQRLRAAGRGYEVADLPILQSFGGAAGYLSVVVLALYVNSPDIANLYRHPQMIWVLCVLLLYWISHVWITAQRGTMHDDPVVFALKDRNSQIVGLLCAMTVVLAT